MVRFQVSFPIDPISRHFLRKSQSSLRGLKEAYPCVAGLGEITGFGIEHGPWSPPCYHRPNAGPWRGKIPERLVRQRPIRPAQLPALDLSTPGQPASEFLLPDSTLLKSLRAEVQRPAMLARRSLHRVR